MARLSAAVVLLAACGNSQYCFSGDSCVAGCTSEYQRERTICNCVGSRLQCATTPLPSDVCEAGKYCHPSNGDCQLQTAQCNRDCGCHRTGPLAGDGVWECVENCGDARICPAAAPTYGAQCSFPSGVQCRYRVGTGGTVATCSCWPADAGSARWGCTSNAP